MSASVWPHARGTAPIEPPPVFFGTEPGYLWWPIGPGEVVGVKLDENGRAVAVAHGTIGRLTALDRPLAGLTGYDTWHPLPGAAREEGAWGYWIAHLPVNHPAAGGDRP